MGEMLWMLKINGIHNTATLYVDNIDKGTIGQIMELCNQKFTAGQNIAIMPDAHVGKGCTIGTTMTLTDKVVPNLVGVDIGCGVLVAKIDGRPNFSLEELDAFIKHKLPTGFSVRQSEHPVMERYKELNKLRCKEHVNLDRAEKSAGTLGGGNHFIELSKDQQGSIYLLIHSGSRHIGKQVAEYYQNVAIDYHEKTFKERLKEVIPAMKQAGTAYKISELLKDQNTRKIPKHLAYLEGQDFDDYMHDMKIIQRYAEINREIMLIEIMNALKFGVEEVFHTTHNYIDMRDPDNMILRKGAVSARKDEKLVIPINMKDGSLLCIGKGNKEMNYSAPHGAGRLLSRKQAKEQLDLELFELEMEEAGIYTTSVSALTLDEAPSAYKDMQSIIDNIGETAEIVSILKPVYNYKA